MIKEVKFVIVISICGWKCSSFPFFMNDSSTTRTIKVLCAGVDISDMLFKRYDSVVSAENSKHKIIIPIPIFIFIQFFTVVSYFC